MLKKSSLVTYLKQHGFIHSPNVIQAFEQVPRKDFVLAKYQKLALVDDPLPIGHEATISQPRTVALMIELLRPQPGDSVLDVGSGSGWTAALLAACVGPSGKVYGLERVPALVEQARSNLKPYSQLKVEINLGNGYEGLPDKAPFDIIHVAAAAEKVPSKLIAQLADGGRLIIPVASRFDANAGTDETIPVTNIDQSSQDLILLTKKAEAISEERFSGFQFVPLLQ